eukprot:5944776-Prymnesium_polylepis.1
MHMPSVPMAMLRVSCPLHLACALHPGGRYVGDVTNGKRHGHGVYYYDSGDKYAPHGRPYPHPHLHPHLHPHPPHTSVGHRVVAAGTPAIGTWASKRATASMSMPMATGACCALPSHDLSRDRRPTASPER